MNHLKFFRLRFGMTQKQLTVKMHTDIQTVKGWEKGEPEPGDDTCRQLAMLFKTDSNAVKGILFFVAQSAMPCTHFHAIGKMDAKSESVISGFWGHLGLLAEHRSDPLWYPVTENTVGFLDSRFQKNRFVTASTLDNKYLLINRDHIEKWGLCGSDQKLPGDEILPWFKRGTYPLELFSLLEEAETLCASSPAKDAENIIRTYHLDRETINELTVKTRILYADGSSASFTVKDYSEVSSFIYHLLFGVAILGDDALAPLHLTTVENGEVSVNIHDVSVIEFPYLKVDENLAIMYGVKAIKADHLV